jgi:hypothetical protein
LHRSGHRLSDRPTESYPPFQLIGHVSRHQVCVQLRLPNFLYVDPDAWSIGDSLQHLSQLLDPLATSPDDNSRPGGMDRYDQFAVAPLDIHARYAGVRVPGQNGVAYPQIF